MITTDAELKLERLVSETLGIFTIKPDKLVKWIPGMFLQLSLTRKAASEPWLDSKPFSIASWGGKEIKIIVRKEGKFTNSLFGIPEEGIICSMKYPLGNFFLNQPGKKIFLAGGAGISVFTSYLDFSAQNNIIDKIVLLHSTSSPHEFLMSFYWNRLPPNIRAYSNFPAINDCKGGKFRFKIEMLNSIVNDLNSWSSYACGPNGYLSYWRDALSAIGLKLKSESWLVS